MVRKFGDQDYIRIGKGAGFKWLGPLPANTHSKTFWRCSKGHSWDASYSAIQSGNGCRICRNARAGSSRRLGPQHYTELAKTRGWIWLGPQVTSTTVKTSWQCEQGHVVKKDYDHVVRGQGCTICTNRVPKTEADYFSLATHLQIDWCGSVVKSTNAKTLWGCRKNHRWESSYNAVASGPGCPVCQVENEQDQNQLLKLAEELGFEWLGLEQGENGNISQWRCKNEHTWKSTLLNLSISRSCKRCTKIRADERLRFGRFDYEKLAQEKRIEWIGTETIQSTVKTLWRCPEKHEWQASFSAIRQHGICPQCAKKQKLAERKPLNDLCKQLAARQEIQWLGIEVFRRQDSTRWKCPKGHEWDAVVADIKRGSGCPLCARTLIANKARKTTADYHALAKQNRFKWLGPEVLKTSVKTEWECDSGHKWFAQFHNISHGTGCPECSKSSFGDQRRFGEANYHQAAIEKSMRWLGPKALKTRDKTNWICSGGHEILATFRVIKDGTGCAVCNRETRAANFETKKAAKPVKKREPGKDRLDLSFGRAKARRTPDDYFALAQHRSLVWLGPEVPTTHAKTQWQCECGNCFDSSFLKIMQGRGCPPCSKKKQAIKRRRTADDYAELAARGGNVWLGPEVTNNKVNTQWRCSLGHEWMASYHSLDAGQGCPRCGKDRASEKTRKKTHDYSALGQERGFEWIGPVVGNAVTKTNWRCKLGHEWSAQYNNISSGSGCPDCAKIIVGDQLRKKAHDYENVAKRNDLVWLGPIVSNSQEKTRWRCSLDHEWAAPYSSISTGHGCPECSTIAGAATRRLSPKAYEACAGAHGFLWKGPTVGSTSTKTGWECPHGHEWRADYNHINMGRGCPKCGKISAAKKTQHLDAAYTALAKTKQIEWLGPLGQNIHTPTEWQCAAGHRWVSSFKAVKNMALCPRCSDLVGGKRTSLPQRLICEMVGGKLNHKVGSYSVDIALFGESEQIAIEYDAWFWHARKQAIDARRDFYLKKMGWKVLRIKAGKKIPEPAVLAEHLAILRAGESYTEIVLTDWGLGKIWRK